jgi:hypothetical protein
MASFSARASALIRRSSLSAALHDRTRRCQTSATGSRDRV